MLENLDLFSANGAQAPASSLYDILGVGILASSDDIKKAWRKQALMHHPDRHPEADESVKERFQAVQHAYEVLRDSLLRSEYDKELLHRLYLEEYLRRFADLILTASGLGLPLECSTTTMRRSCSARYLEHLETSAPPTIRPPAAVSSS